MDYPVYELRINPDDNSFVDAIALVDSPAIESDFLAFAEQKNLSFSTNEEKMELLGPAMIPDMKIYRQDDKNGGYYVYFSKDTIRQIAQVYFKKGLQRNINLDHSPIPSDSYFYQSYLVDEARGMTSPKGMDLPDGSWVVGMKAETKEAFDEAKKRKGFSVEGLFQFKTEFNTTIEKEEEELMNILSKTLSLINKQTKTK